MDNLTADRAVPPSKFELGLSRRPLVPQTNEKIFELDDDFDTLDEPRLAPRRAVGKTASDEAPRFSMVRRAVALASDAVVLTLASPFFAAWLIYRGVRALFRWAVPAATAETEVPRAPARSPVAGS